MSINRKYPSFITNLNENIASQLDRFANTRIENELKNNKYITDSNVLIDYIVTNKEFKTDTIKVGVFLEDNFDNMNACPYIRIHAPFSKLSKSNDYHFFIYGQEIMPLLDTDNMINAHIFDVIVIQRVNPYSNTILKKAKKHNIKVVYESDDDFLDISHDNPSYNYILGNFDHILKLVNNSDKLVVSTNELKNRFNKLGLDNVEVIKNYYVEDVLPLKPFTFRGEDHVKIGYFGTLTHDNDLELIHNVIVRVKDIFSKKGVSVIFEIAGASIDDSVDWFNVRKIPYYPMSLRTFYEWLGKNSDWDVGIIPLADNNFNRCKSELKYIEFSALGVPVVASNINVYSEAIVDGVTGYLASNEEEWIDKLSILIEDHILRNGMVNNAHEDILKNYSLKSRVNQWDEIFKSLTK